MSVRDKKSKRNAEKISQKGRVTRKGTFTVKNSFLFCSQCIEKSGLFFYNMHMRKREGHED